MNALTILSRLTRISTRFSRSNTYFCSAFRPSTNARNSDSTTQTTSISVSLLSFTHVPMNQSGICSKSRLALIKSRNWTSDGVLVSSLHVRSGWGLTENPRRWRRLPAWRLYVDPADWRCRCSISAAAKARRSLNEFMGASHAGRTARRRRQASIASALAHPVLVRRPIQHRTYASLNRTSSRQRRRRPLLFRPHHHHLCGSLGLRPCAPDTILRPLTNLSSLTMTHSVFLAGRILGRIQLTKDAFRPYPDAGQEAFGTRVDLPRRTRITRPPFRRGPLRPSTDHQQRNGDA